MAEETQRQTRQNCCRLCLAPDSECISILNSYAADKEPLATKILHCVNIKVSPNDGLSLRICHACISYLNSWQSFKNRCVASQGKQMNWLEFTKRQQLLDNNVSISTISTKSLNRQQQHRQQQQQHLERENFHQESNLPSSILDGITSLKKRKSLTVYPLPAVQVKDEPMDDEDYDTMKHHDESDEMVDPTLFLERTEEESTEPYMDTSNFSYDMSRLGNNSHVRDRTTIEVAAAVEVKEASCRACNLKFSTRANARRHERNLHPNLFELSTSTPNSAPVTKPTPALAAALELQRAAMNAAAEAAKKSGSAALTTPQKLRQEIVNAVNATESGFNYENPEHYQELLTDEKIVFLQQNEEFLQQYQTMTCKCCRKFYTSYKNFMAHMRKKYVTLPRNLCFNCLKLNDSKALFISHLKKRNCINLYKVMHALMVKVPSFAAAVAATAAAMPEKLRAKELLVNKIYECKLCSKHFRLKLEFRSHVYDEHADAQKKDVTPGQCGFCGMEIEDPLERKRHYNNMDCIVILRCVTCDERFSNHQKFLDHVYAKHLVPGVVSEQQQQQQQKQQQQQQHQLQQRQLASNDNSPGKKSSGFAGTSSADESRSSIMHVTAAKSQYFSRMPQACPICGQQYNNYNNVLRHMESKHPDQLPQTYKCVKCGTGYPRLSNLREHMLTSHGANNEKTRTTSFEYIVNADAVKAMEGAGGGGSGSGAYTGRYDYVMKDLLSITNGGTTAEDDNDEDVDNSPATKKMRIDDGNGHNTATAASNLYSSYKECPICSAIFSNNIGLSNHMRSHTAAAQSAAAAAAAASTSATAAVEPTKVVETATAASAVATSTPQQKTTSQQAVFKRSLELAADRRFRRMRCRICQKRFSSKKSYSRHMLDEHQIRNVQFIKCKLCDAEFAYEKGLKVHMFKIHNTLLKDEMIIKQYECDICSIVYRTEDQLLTHKKTVHGNENAHPDDYVAAEKGGQCGDASNVAAADKSSISTSIRVSAAPLDTSASTAPLYWYQCKYCPSNFNTNKKLAIHINSHDEFDSNDYSCKDCGNVYSGRKSLWVHRYKKHPQIAEPSECVLCRKVFFDRQMLDNHVPICNRKPITATGAVAENATSLNNFYRHKTGDDEDDDGSRDLADEDGVPAGRLGGGEVEITAIPATSSKLKIKLPEVACTICGQRFTDQELFAKHIQVHEMELYTDNPLAAMFDTGPADPNQFYLDRVNDNGEYACDICPKTFTQMTALKVHRKWHFRGDNKQNQADGDLSASATSQTLNLQHPPGLQAVGLIPNPRPSKSLKRKRELKCEYCPSTFISNNNLRRHIYELHKSEIANMPEPPKIDTDDYLHCRKCELKFESRKEWFEHKISDARVMKPYGPFQWGCELCGEYVSRKEKLIHHIQSHMKEKNVIPVQERKEQEMKSAAAAAAEAASSKVNNNNNEVTDRDNDGTESNSQDSQQSEGNAEYDNEAEHAVKEESEDDDAEDEEEEEDDENDENDENDEIDDGAAEVDEDVDGECDEENEGEVEGDAEEDDEADAENIENVDDNANDGQDGNDVADDEDDVDDVDDEEDDDDDDADDVEDDDTNDVKIKQSTKNSRKSADTTEVEDSNPYEGDEDDGDDEDNDDAEQEDEDVDADVEEDIDEDVENSINVGGKHKAPEPKKRYACDLCQVFFDTQQELQKHVKMHFLNGPGSVTLTEIRAKRINKSRSSGSSDVVTVSSS